MAERSAAGPAGTDGAMNHRAMGDGVKSDQGTGDRAPPIQLGARLR